MSNVCKCGSEMKAVAAAACTSCGSIRVGGSIVGVEETPADVSALRSASQDQEVLHIAVRRLRAENERLQDGIRRVCNLIWPYRSDSDARRSIADAEGIRRNLADGRTWDGSNPGAEDIR